MASKSDKPVKDNNDNRTAEEALAESQAGGVIETIDKNRKVLLIGIIGAAVAICAFLVIRQAGTQKLLEAGTAFTAAAAKKDIPALDGVLVKFPGSIPAGNALLTKAEIQIDQGKAKDAQTSLEKFNSDYKSHPRQAQGLFALATLHHKGGDKEKAKDLYNQSISAEADSELTPLSLIRLGDLALEAGDKDTADQFYQDSYIKHPGNQFTSLANQKIELLTVGNPPEVDAPKPPAPPKKKEAAKPVAPKTPAVKPKAATPKPAAPKPAAPKPAAPKPAAKPKVATPKPAAPKPAAVPKPAVKLKPIAPKPAVPPAPKPVVPKPAPSGN